MAVYLQPQPYSVGAPTREFSTTSVRTENQTMDTTEIRATYDALARVAQAGSFQPENADEWPTEKIVAHAIATNQTLNRVGIELLDGRDVSYEGGTLSVRDEWLEAIIDAAGDLPGIVTYLRQSYGELLALADRFDEDTGNRKFHGRIFDGKGNIQLEAEMSFADIVTTYLVRHMRNHTQQIKSLVEAGHASRHPSLIHR
jgi:hypothetical protein